MAYSPRGLESRHEQDHHKIIRDTRPLGMRIADFLKNPRGVAYMLIALAIGVLFLGYLSELFIIFGAIFFAYCLSRHFSLPFRLPLRSKERDHNDPAPGSGKPRMARGIYYFGNEKRTKEELWFANEDMRTHVLIFGSTGSGKTEALVSLAYNALLQASGFIYVDGKGDNGLFAKVFSMVRSMGRDDDMLLINFMTGARDIIGPQERRLSNTLNPFARGSSSMLSQLVVSLMNSSSKSSDGDMWKGRAIGFVEAIMRVLVAMRDSGYILLDANTVRNYFLLPKLEAIVIDKVFLRDGDEPVNLDFLPKNILEPIVNYVYNLPGYNKEKKGKQVSQVLEQHGYITMQLTRVFTSLADTYGHIMRTNLAEVDLNDVVLNRRILCVLLPALEKSPDELSNLGKVIIATLKAMMAAGLGDGVEGEFEDLIESKPTNAETPFLCILDEYGYYAVEGFAVVPAQARSLGFSVIFAGQDLPAFQKASKEEAASIGANTNIKICMKLEDPTETWDFFMKSAGEAYVSHVESFQVDSGSVLGTYQDGRGSRLEKRQRVDLLDLKEQAPGEAHIFFRSKIVRSRFFYANPKIVKKLRLNHFLKVDAPSDGDVHKILNGFKQFERLSQVSSDYFDGVSAPSEEIERLAGVLADVPAAQENLSAIFRCALALGQFQSVMAATGLSEAVEAMDELPELPEGRINLFAPLRVEDEDYKEILITDDLNAFCEPILDRRYMRDQLEYIERLCGKRSQQALNVAMEIINDIESSTDYPPKYQGDSGIETLEAAINAIVKEVEDKHNAKETDDEDDDDLD